jgi:hypothetical protein
VTVDYVTICENGFSHASPRLKYNP